MSNGTGTDLSDNRGTGTYVVAGRAIKINFLLQTIRQNLSYHLVRLKAGCAGLSPHLLI
jgi:hypothetical protein